MNIVFFYPSKNIGGAQLLFIRIANELSKNNNYNVYIIDYQDGYLKNNTSERVLHIDYLRNKNYNFEGKTCVITPLSMIDNIKDIIPLSYNSKYLLWGIHPENTIDILRGTYRLKRILPFNFDLILKIINIIKFLRIRKYIIKALKENTIIFMDKANKDRTFEFYNVFQNYKTYLPVPIDIASEKINYQKQNKNSIAWIGRLSNDKIYSLIFALEEFNKITNSNFIFHVIGDGECKDKINLENYTNLNIKLHGFIENNELHNLLIKERIGLVVGMGTSVLESSIRGLPSLLIDPTYKKLGNEYSPCWLFETKEYTLGTFNYIKRNKSMSILLNEYLNDNINTIGERCYNYVYNSHSLSSTIDKLEIYFEESVE